MSDPKQDVFPHTVAKAVDQLLFILNDEQKAEIANLPREQLSQLHFGIGMDIRNSFGLWADNRDLLDDCTRRSSRHGGCQGKDSAFRIHPDDASTVILEALWERLHH